MQPLLHSARLRRKRAHMDHIERRTSLYVLEFMGLTPELSGRRPRMLRSYRSVNPGGLLERIVSAHAETSRQRWGDAKPTSSPTTQARTMQAALEQPRPKWCSLLERMRIHLTRRHQQAQARRANAPTGETLAAPQQQPT